ncbi:MAG: terminase [Planctomycetaceae bacterium]|nr:terminase [Planctomycetaceae bacterium]
MAKLTTFPPLEEITDDDTLAEAMKDPMWRLSNLYWILIKSDDGEGDGLRMKFKPNRAQRKLLKRVWHRNVILKARQLGFTTLIAIFFLDCALFRANVRAGIIAQDLPAVETIFRDKVKYGYDSLPEAIKAKFPLKTETKRELVFAHNNSSIRVGTSMRSGTLQYLHVSEFGKIGAKFPERAREVITGSIPALAQDGILFIESTAEGAEGEFYEISERARKLADSGKKLSVKDYRFHFYPWWDAPDYRADPDLVIITKEDDEYFDKVEADMRTTIDIEQRAWYVMTKEAEFSGDEQKMWQEFPSTPKEAFQRSTEGCYYAVQMTKMRKEKRITRVPYTPGYPVNTFWDIGKSDGTAVWFHQHIGQEHRFINFIEGWGEPYSYFVTEMQKLGYVWGDHYLPHDGTHVRQGQDYDSQLSPQEMLHNLGLRNIEIVPRVEELQHGIQTTRDKMAVAWIDETNCAKGIVHLDRYQKQRNRSTGGFTDKPVKHDGHSEAADAFRQWAQGYSTPSVRAGTRPKRRNRSGAVA